MKLLEVTENESKRLRKIDKLWTGETSKTCWNAIENTSRFKV